MSELGAFHFLRPGWLLALLPAGLIAWRLLRRVDAAAAWRGLIAPHLLAHLLVGRDAQRRALGPVWLLLLAWVAGIVALAGPAWRHEPAPFAEDRAALVIALEVTPAMLARDVQPSRLERAVQKITDLVARRTGAPTALLAYAGSAHRVMPLTRDGRIVAQFAAELSPQLMPRDGDDPAAAVDLALDELERAGVPGSVLLVSGTLPSDLPDSAGERARSLGVGVHVLAVAAGPEVTPAAGSPPAPALDRDAFDAAARALGASWVAVTVDDRDLATLERTFARQVAIASGERTQWRDDGYPLVFVVALLALSWFRRGWRVTTT